MKTGTKSILVGAHQFLLHPLFVAAAWTKLFGFPTDPRLWVAFYTHDLGYWGLENMDSLEGERHVELGARIMARLFDDRTRRPGAVLLNSKNGNVVLYTEEIVAREERHALPPRPDQLLNEWGQFSLLHSRFYSKRLGLTPSRLCIADKLAMALEPTWLYLPRVLASGEVWEYLQEFAFGKYREGGKVDITPEELAARRLTRRTWTAIRTWHSCTRTYMRLWVAEHADGRADTWTKA